MPLRVMMIGPYPRALNRIDGGVTAATTYLSQALSIDPEIHLTGVRLDGRADSREVSQELGWPMDQIDLQRFSVSTLFRRQQRQLAELIRRHRPDVIHAQGADAAGYLAIRSGVPTVVTIHGILTECAWLQTSRLRRLRELAQARITERFVVERAAHVVAISPYVARHYRGQLRGVVHSIPNPVASPFYKVRREPVRGRILFAGRISRGKGVLDLLGAAARESASVSHLVLAGAHSGADFESRIASEAGRPGLAGRVSIAGLLDEPALLGEFARADCLVLPSYQETSPMVVQQAMASGLPVIATRVGGIPDLIEHDRSGLLYDPGDVDGLCSLLRRINRETGLTERLSGAARAIADERYTSPTVANETKRVYLEMRGPGDSH